MRGWVSAYKYIEGGKRVGSRCIGETDFKKEKKTNSTKRRTRDGRSSRVQSSGNYENHTQNRDRLRGRIYIMYINISI